jgi:hypothetical protein
MRAALASVADTALIPMQDLLGLGSEARMNLPGRQAGNWGFRFRWAQLTPDIPLACASWWISTTARHTEATCSRAATKFSTIWNMSFGFLGIQFGWGLQMANMSAIYEYLGASADEIPMLWLAAPLTGLIVQPIIGHLSDHTWSPRSGAGARSSWWRRSSVAGAHRDAQLERAVDGGGAALDPRRLDQHLDGSRSAPSSPTCCRSRSARAASRCSLLHRRGRGARLGDAVDADQLVRRDGPSAPGTIPITVKLLVLHRFGGVLRRGAVHHPHDQGTPAGRHGGVRREEAERRHRAP